MLYRLAIDVVAALVTVVDTEDDAAVMVYHVRVFADAGAGGARTDDIEYRAKRCPVSRRFFAANTTTSCPNWCRISTDGVSLLQLLASIFAYRQGQRTFDLGDKGTTTVDPRHPGKHNGPFCRRVEAAVTTNAVPRVVV
jgi:hypothetical protein